MESGPIQPIDPIGSTDHISSPSQSPSPSPSQSPSPPPPHSYDPNKVNLPTVTIKSLLLGIIISVTCNNIFHGLWPQLNIYIFSIACFHLLEFFSICLFNITEVDDDSFILTDYELMLINGLTIIEFLVYKWVDISQPSGFKYTGLLLMVIGQIFRTLAIVTAGESFNHYIQRTKRSNHQLIVHGVYKYIRHPSYFGFFWWFIGLRLYMNNWILLMVGGYKLSRFFQQRIEFEESFLVNFFGQRYIDYKQRSVVGIPMRT